MGQGVIKLVSSDILHVISKPTLYIIMPYHPLFIILTVLRVQLSTAREFDHAMQKYIAYLGL